MSELKLMKPIAVYAERIAEYRNEFITKNDFIKLQTILLYIERIEFLLLE